MIKTPPPPAPSLLCPQAAPDSDGSIEVLLPLGIVPCLDPSPLPSPPPKPGEPPTALGKSDVSHCGAPSSGERAM